jgi:branched-chain amino acid transport system substrate-binding protein
LKAGTDTTRGKLRFGNNNFPIQDYYLTEVKRGSGSVPTVRSIEKIEVSAQDSFAKSCPLK